LGVPSAGEEKTAPNGHRPRRMGELQAPDDWIARRAEGETLEDEASEAPQAG